MKPMFICYSKCGTCRKAKKWLLDNDFEVDYREISIDKPSFQELSEWIKLSGKPINKFFNTSGLLYRELGVKDLIKTQTERVLLELLSSNGMLVKRPLLISNNKVLVGFNEEEYKSFFDRII